MDTALHFFHQTFLLSVNYLFVKSNVYFLFPNSKFYLSDEPFSIIHPVLIKPNEGNIEHQLYIQAPELGQNFTVFLIQNPHIVSKDVVILETFTNGSSPINFPKEEYFCHFRGETAAINLCNGVVSASFH